VKLCVRLIASPPEPPANREIPEPNNMTQRIINLAMRVNTRLGPGLLKCVYERLPVF
jgi:hypothetical protein